MSGHSKPLRHPPSILVALLASSVLHCTIILLPYLGQSSRQNEPSVTMTRQGRPIFTATLTTPKKSPFRKHIPPQIPPTPAEITPPETPMAEQPVQQHREGADLLPIEAPLFYPTDQLSHRPQPIEVKELETPEIKSIVASGKMILKIWINDLGEVVDVEIEKSDLPEVFANSAASVFRSMRFTPGERQGKPVGTVMRIEVSYDDGRKLPGTQRPPP